MNRMNKIELDLDDLELLERISAYNNSGGNIYIDGEVIYKIFIDNGFFIDEKKRNIEYLYESNWANPKILGLIYNRGVFVGYVEELIKGAKTFKEGIADESLKIDDKCRKIYDVYDKLRLLHERDIFVGDIHLENFIYNEQGGYIIDLDEIRFKDVDCYKFMEYYTVRNSNVSVCKTMVDKTIDNIKATICALSLLYNYNFEAIAKKSGTDMVEFYLDAFTDDDSLKDGVHTIFNDNCSDILYFDEILEDKVKIKRKGV